MANLRELFPEFFQLEISSEDLSTKTDNLIVLDTNYLLEVIKSPTIVSKEYVDALKKVKKNIYIPYLVALEFNFNKSGLKKKKKQDIHNYKNHVRNKVVEFIEEINEIPFINDDNKKEFTNDIIELTDNFSVELQATIERKINSLVTDEQENLYNELIKIIEDRIGDIYTQEWIDEIQKEGEERFENSIPPGFNDKAKEKNDSYSKSTRRYGNILYQRKFGDLLIWKDILKHAKTNQKGKKVIFITDDGKSGKKTDLLYKYSGVTVGPHIHLMNEMYMNCQKEFYILDNLRFIQLVNNLTDEQVNSLKININKTNDKYINNDCKREKAEFLTKFIDVMNDSDIPLFVREKMFEEIKKIDYDEVSVDDLKKLYMLSLSYKNQKKRRNQLIHKKMDLLDDDSKLNFEKYLMKSIYEQNNHKELNILKDEYDGENDKLSKLTPEEINKLLDFLNDDENL